MGALYSGSECVVEKARAGARARFAAPANAALTLRVRVPAHSCARSTTASTAPPPAASPAASWRAPVRCTPLLALAAPQKMLTHASIRLAAGWQGALGGCATFAAFSVLMDKLLDH
jgi:hypothetical protein